ncbi:hypothetical protein [Micropruina sonneratiae]|uniref:hypothetical protein n=1 Tax=Micropruina sonneratiae TaxID=2986940 RepID=UPI002227D82F|nr:hypothetical protein [Micropruina sp. KQZ13P-5]MCW3156829.1 hypothetical protein [Micropruina sp. KQZ13P-5]
MRAGGWRQWAHLALAAVGVAAVLWALVLGAHPTIWCRDQVMQPGQTCSNAQGTKVQTYEERFSAAQWARPVVGGVGLAVTGFALALYRGGRRTRVPA